MTRHKAGWSALGEDDDLASFQESLPVRIIATPRSRFEGPSVDQDLASALAGSEAFDFLPVSDGGAIVGLLNASRARDLGVSEGSVRSHMEALSERNLLGADASILDFIRAAAERPCRLIVAAQSITGIVTLSDLQRLPVRAALFALVTHLEMAMAGVIRSAFPGEEWMAYLSDGRRARVKRETDAARQKDAFVEALLFTQFCDKRDLIERAIQLPARDAREFKSQFKVFEALRNNLAHSNDYANDRVSAAELSRTVVQIDRWIGRLSDLP